MEALLAQQCHQKIQVFTYLGRIDGDPSFSAGVEYSCYAETMIQTVLNEKGDEVISDTLVIIDGIHADKITKSDEVSLDIIGRRPILKIGYFPSLIGGGFDHLEVFV